ncbi:MAG: nitroreductase family protein [Candidatus Bipolaricaulia bacterium]
MNTIEAIEARRSIRRFKSEDLPEEALRKILIAASKAPSGKNRQPWRFVVVREDRRAEMVRVLREAIGALRARGEDTGSAEWTADIMEQAPVTVFVINPHGIDPWVTREADQAFQELVDVQSVGAAIQNMLLTAVDLGIGSLWIADVLYAVTEFKDWLGEEGQLVAAISFGVPDESPEPRPRKPLEEIVRGL